MEPFKRDLVVAGLCGWCNTTLWICKAENSNQMHFSVLSIPGASIRRYQWVEVRKYCKTKIYIKVVAVISKTNKKVC